MRASRVTVLGVSGIVGGVKREIANVVCEQQHLYLSYIFPFCLLLSCVCVSCVSEFVVVLFLLVFFFFR